MEKEFNLSDKIEFRAGLFANPTDELVSISNIKEFIKRAEKKGRYANGIEGNAMCITIQELKELAGEKFR